MLCVSGSNVASREFAMRPDFAERPQQLIDVAIAVDGGRRNAQSFGATWHSGIVDWLHVNAVIIHQPVADEFALMRVANHDRNDVAWVRNMRNAHPVQCAPHFRNAVLMHFAFGGAGLEMLDACASAGRNSGW